MAKKDEHPAQQQPVPQQPAQAPQQPMQQQQPVHQQQPLQQPPPALRQQQPPRGMKQLQSSQLKVEQFVEILGYDPAAKTGAPSLFQKAVKELKEERDLKIVGTIKTLVGQGEILIDKRNKLVNEFVSAVGKIDGELGRIMTSLKNMSSGTPEPEPLEGELIATPA